MRPLTVDVVKQAYAALTTPRLHKRLYQSICSAILQGQLRPHARLPPSRDLAEQLALSRNTVLRVYEQLQAEGYVVTRPNSGTFVADTAPDSLPSDGQRQAVTPAPPRAVTFSQRGQAVLNRAGANQKQLGAFIPGVPDLASYPHRLFSKILARQSRRLHPERLTYDTQGGLPELKSAIADYLLTARGVRCKPDQILITEGVHQALDLVTRVLCDIGETVWIEEPGYWGIKNILNINGVQAIPLPVDDQGIQLPAAGTEPPRIIFVTPSHQYPLGPVMSLARRQQLLAFARQHQSWIVEDDYDSEFRFSGSPVPSLQGLEPDGPVIYIGTFSKTLYPGLRVGYMVLPQPLAGPVRTLHNEIYRSGHLLMQATLAEFISEGHYTSHIRKMRQRYGRRRARLEELIIRRLGPEFVAATNSNAGLHLVLALPDKVSDRAIALAADAEGIIVRPLSGYYHQAERRQGLLLGFASLAEGEMESAFERLAGIIQRHL